MSDFDEIERLRALCCALEERLDRAERHARMLAGTLQFVAVQFNWDGEAAWLSRESVARCVRAALDLHADHLAEVTA